MDSCNITITVHTSLLYQTETFTGQPCAGCGDPIYGEGERVIIAMNIDNAILPRFKETTAKVCRSCYNALQTKEI